MTSRDITPEVVEMARRDRRVLHQVLVAMRGLVKSMARSIARRGESHYEDYVQAGLTGVWQAVHSYDAARGTAFHNYAIPLARNEILDTYRAYNRVLWWVPKGVDIKFVELDEHHQVSQEDATDLVHKRLVLGWYADAREVLFAKRGVATQGDFESEVLFGYAGQHTGRPQAVSEALRRTRRKLQALWEKHENVSS